MIGGARREAGGRPLLVPATATLLFVVMVSSFTPTPLYPIYQAQWGLSDELVAIAFAAYAVAVLAALILLGGMSDRLGRRPTLLTSIAVLVVAMAILAAAPSYAFLVLGRVVQGLGVALAAGAGAATLMESHPGGLSRGALANTLSLASGSAMGPAVSGFLAGASAFPLVFPYLAVILMLVVPAVMLIGARDLTPGLAHARIVKSIRLPRELWGAFSIAAVAVLGTNLTMGVYGSFGSEVAGAVGWTSQERIGLVVSTVLLALAVVQVVARRLAPKTAMLGGISLATVGWATVAIAAANDLPWALVLGSAVVGAGAGMCLMGSAALVGIISPTDRRAEIYSAYLVVAFGALGTMALVSGVVIGATSISAVLWASCVACIAITAYIGLAGRRLLARWR